ncbi:MAG TPA: hypothetical protein VKD66_00010 [Streptosporangiaceae bacterium]|nr:hypothetical protein [Streptosporangiaceae bacterium]
MNAAVVLDPGTLAAVGALLGGLSGAVTFLFRQLISSKDAQIAALAREIEAQRTVMMAEIHALKSERDYFRDLAFRAARRRASDASDVGG